MLANELFGDEATFTWLPVWITALLAEHGIVGVKRLDSIVTAIADVNLPRHWQAFHAMNRVAEVGGFFVAFGVIGQSKPSCTGGGVINGICSISSEMTDIFAGVGVDDQDVAIAVAIRDIQTVGLRVAHHIGGPIEQWRAINAATRVVAIGTVWRPSDPHFEVAIHVELQNEAVTAIFIRGPGRPSGTCTTSASSPRRCIPPSGPAARGISRNPYVVVLVDVNTLLTIRPDAASFLPAFAADKAGVGWTAPGA